MQAVAKSLEKNKAVVTYHILFDWNLAHNFKHMVLGISKDEIIITTLGQLLDRLNSLSGILDGGLDKDAWTSAINFLSRMYGHTL